MKMLQYFFEFQMVDGNNMFDLLNRFDESVQSKYTNVKLIFLVYTKRSAALSFWIIQLFLIFFSRIIHAILCSININKYLNLHKDQPYHPDPVNRFVTDEIEAKPHKLNSFNLFFLKKINVSNINNMKIEISRQETNLIGCFFSFKFVNLFTLLLQMRENW